MEETSRGKTNRPLIGVQLRDRQNDADDQELRQLIDDLNVEITIAPLHWGEVERNPGDRDWKDVEHWERLEKVAGPMPAKVWTLYPVHMNARGPMPSDLRTMPFERPEMLERFEKFAADAAARAGWDDGHTIVKIGNEVDLFAGEHGDEVPGFIEFANNAADVIRRYAPKAKVANALTWDSVKRDRGLFDALNANTDVVALNWYDLGGGLFVGKSNLAEEVEMMLEKANRKAVLITEIGLPSGEPVGSSDQIQAERVDELFDVLSHHDRNELYGAIWLSLNDWPRKRMEDFVSHQFSTLAGNEAFLSFLITLGLRREDGTPKPAFKVWKRRAEAYAGM